MLDFEYSGKILVTIKTTFATNLHFLSCFYNPTRPNSIWGQENQIFIKLKFQHVFKKTILNSCCSRLGFMEVSGVHLMKQLPIW